MTRVETILDHVVSWAHVESNGLLLGAYLTHQLGRSCDGNNHVEGKLWIYKVLSNKCTSWLGCIVLASGHTMHSTLVDKLTKWPRIGKITHYQQCFLHVMKFNQIYQYMKGEWITTTKDGIEFSNNEINFILKVMDLTKLHGLWKYKRCFFFHSLCFSIVCGFNWMNLQI
jgi:hypothetical protein